MCRSSTGAALDGCLKEVVALVGAPGRPSDDDYGASYRRSSTVSTMRDWIAVIMAVLGVLLVFAGGTLLVLNALAAGGPKPPAPTPPRPDATTRPGAVGPPEAPGTPPPTHPPPRPPPAARPTDRGTH